MEKRDPPGESNHFPLIYGRRLFSLSVMVHLELLARLLFLNTAVLDQLIYVLSDFISVRVDLIREPS